MDYLLENHLKFLNRIYGASLISSNGFTILPTIVFLISTFVFVYQQSRRRITPYTRWKMKILHNLKMHWLFFNVCRIWFILLSASRKVLSIANEYIERHVHEDDQLYNRLVLVTLTILIISLFSLFPLILIYLSSTSNRENFPNLLMWVIEDPWLHHEIGTSVRCLQFPNNSNMIKSKNPSYRIRRSISYDLNYLNNDNSNNTKKFSRETKSVIEFNVVKSIDDLY